MSIWCCSWWAGELQPGRRQVLELLPNNIRNLGCQQVRFVHRRGELAPWLRSMQGLPFTEYVPMSVRTSALRLFTICEPSCRNSRGCTPEDSHRCSERFMAAEMVRNCFA
jgi:hypothetical protein